MRSYLKRIVTLLAISLSAVTGSLFLGTTAKGQSADQAVMREGDVQVPITISQGHDTDPRDHGRPVILVAAALGVPADVFRATFRNVSPAPSGHEPDPAQVNLNKQALLRGLGPYGVTNDRLDTVSDYYRYNGSRGELWRNRRAVAFATVKDGKIVRITITNPGAGYSSVPILTLPGMSTVKLKVALLFGTDLSKNGSLKSITAE